MNRSLLGLMGVTLLVFGCSGKAEIDSSSSGGNAGRTGGGGAGDAAGAGGKVGTAGTGGSGQCVDGQRMGSVCSDCTCIQGQWECTSGLCGFCGGESGNTCGANQYCAYTAGSLCGAADATALCAQRPIGCDSIYMPVCGCDHVTYPSSCVAAMNGQGVYTDGPCDDPDDGSGGAGGAGGDDAGGSAGTGGAQCVPGTTEKYACETCECGPDKAWLCDAVGCPPKECGAMAGDTCGPDEFCAYYEGLLCGAADATAMCSPKPMSCPKGNSPVCGCDGKTYASSCDAGLHGQGVYTNGPCDNSTAN